MKRYYSPQLDRDLVSALYHEAKRRHTSMTKLASRLLRSALAFEQKGSEEAPRNEIQTNALPESAEN